MPGTGTPDSIPLRPSASPWHNFGWKLLAALLILLLLTAGIPVSAGFLWVLVWGTLLLWGGLVVAIASYNLLSAPGNLLRVWVALALGAYAALVVPGIFKQDPSLLAAALAPVAALTLAAHLGRRDLPLALRDWALIMALSLYAALGVASMSLVITGFGGTTPNGLIVFIVAVLLPPLILESLLILIRRTGRLGENLWAQLGAVILATALPIVVLSLTQLHSATPLFASLAFDLLAGLVIGGALLVSLRTRPMIEAAAATRGGSQAGAKLGRALVELSHGPILISLALYIPLRLLTGAVG
jgi:hypothetical protein